MAARLGRCLHFTASVGRLPGPGYPRIADPPLTGRGPATTEVTAEDLDNTGIRYRGISRPWLTAARCARVDSRTRPHEGGPAVDRAGLADFLRTRRGARQPEDVGLPRLAACTQEIRQS